jgi:hypothetical protein
LNISAYRGAGSSLPIQRLIWPGRQPGLLPAADPVPIIITIITTITITTDTGGGHNDQ